MRYFLLPLGCATNRSDAERIAGVLESLGYSPAENENQADLIGIVACSIRQTGIDRIFGKARNWNKRKKREHLLTFVSGCILPADEKKFLKIFDFAIKLNKIHELPQLLQEYGASVSKNFWEIAPRRSSTFKALIPIQNGCNNFCSYCAVPYTRGREISRPSDDILTEITSLIAAGVKQITLLGQNVNSYGQDYPRELNFAQLLQKIGEITNNAPHQIWVHFTSPHPKDMTEETFDVMRAFPSLAKYLNFPLQSGNDEILRRMNRRYTYKEYKQILDLARTKIPQLTVTTDIIVGFCGESVEQFHDTARAMEWGNYDLAFIAQYSSRAGTLAADRYPDDVPREEKKRRVKMLTAILAKTALTHNRLLVRQTVPVLAESVSRKPHKILGRTEGLKSVEFSGDANLIGQFVNIKITGCDSWRLFGGLV